jgi:Anti-sigma factor NepR
MAAQHHIEKGDVRLAPQIQSNIGQELRVVYMDVVDQRVPEHLQKLLERLDDQDDVIAKDESKDEC